MARQTTAMIGLALCLNSAPANCSSAKPPATAASSARMYKRTVDGAMLCFDAVKAKGNVLGAENRIDLDGRQIQPKLAL